MLNQYQSMALRTMADQATIRVRNYTDAWAMAVLPETLIQKSGLAPSTILVQIDNASRGMGADVGEVLTCVQRCLEYGKALDVENMKEELGDVLWRIVQMCDALDTTLEEIAKRNVAKLQARYPEKYTDEQAHEENRNREAEAVAMASVQTGAGWAEPPEEKEVTNGPHTLLEDDRYQDPDYSRRCNKCGASIHRSNTVGLCTSCVVTR